MESLKVEHTATTAHEGKELAS